MLKIKEIHFKREREILSGISFNLKSSSIIGLVGPSGAGKSTLLKIVSGLLEADKGTVHLNQQRVYGPSFRLIPGHPEIQLVNQDFDLDLYHTVRENLLVKANYLPDDLCNELIDELLELMELTPLQNKQAIHLSGGEQQRLAMGRSLAKEPEVILLDEPFAHMDAHLRNRISDYLLKLKKIRKTSFMLVTHDGEEVLSLADRILFFNDGKILREDTPENFYFNPSNEFEGLFFGDLNSVTIKNRKILFRPIEFDLELTEIADQLDLKFIKSVFFGAYYKNYFLTKKKESIILYHSESLSHVQKIAIKKKNN
ncbi:MAG: ABC transporter ATP-binding protein [Crocinitomicaceae bacterium]|nr:ABC transporter ATP-binding protein [Crocinitomicaceae bacterium]